MWTYSALGILAICMTVISLRWYNLLLSFVACISWVILWAFNLNNPPTSVVQGSFVHEALVYLYIIMAILTMLLYFRNRGEAKHMFNTNTEHEGVEPNKSTANEPIKSILNMSSSEYRESLRRRTNRRSPSRMRR